MSYQKKYNQKKEELINNITEAFEKSIELLKIKDLSINFICFKDGRNENDFLNVELSLDKEYLIKITFWINFYLGFDFQKDDPIIVYNIENNDEIVNKSIKYSKIKGKTLNVSIFSLLKEILLNLN